MTDDGNVTDLFEEERYTTEELIGHLQEMEMKEVLILGITKDDDLVGTHNFKAVHDMIGCMETYKQYRINELMGDEE